MNACRRSNCSNAALVLWMRALEEEAVVDARGWSWRTRNTRLERRTVNGACLRLEIARKKERRKGVFCSNTELSFSLSNVQV